MAIGPLELVIILVMLGLPVLVIVLLVRGKDNRPCPQCAKRVKKGRVDCPHCEYDFRLQSKPASRSVKEPAGGG